MPLLTEAELEAIRATPRPTTRRSACGVLLVRPGPAEERRLRACRNIQDELHAQDPGRFPRTARTAYYIAHEDLLEIGRREGEGFEVRVIYHSHIDAGAYFSETDRRNAMVDGVPAYPQTTYVVVSVAGGSRRGHPARIGSAPTRASSSRCPSPSATAPREQKAVDGSGGRLLSSALPCERTYLPSRPALTGCGCYRLTRARRGRSGCGAACGKCSPA